MAEVAFTCIHITKEERACNAPCEPQGSLLSETSFYIKDRNKQLWVGILLYMMAMLYFLQKHFC